MKNLVIPCLLLLAASCTKSTDQQQSSPSNDEKETCSFGLSEFNMAKRPMENGQMNKGKPVSNNGPNGTGGTGTTSGGGTTITPANVILLDFNGQYVANTMWNVNGPITCAPANLTAEEAALVLQRVATDFTPFNITVTTDEAVYNAATAKRMRVVITESWEWYGQAGGVSYINSFTWGDNTPCFVFSSLLGYSVKKIAEAASHETGHTLGLRHQALYDQNGVKLNDYNWGNGSGEIGWAPIMGASYNENLSLWHYGPNSLSATTMQDDVAKIASVVGFLNDEYPNSITGTTSLGTSKTGLINNSTDVDFFSLNINSTKTLSLIPANVGPNNDGGNLDLVLKIYNSQGVLISSINDPMILNAGVNLSAGSYYISASTTDNQFASRYGMLSKYTMGIN